MSCDAGDNFDVNASAHNMLDLRWWWRLGGRDSPVQPQMFETFMELSSLYHAFVHRCASLSVGTTRDVIQPAALGSLRVMFDGEVKCWLWRCGLCACPFEVLFVQVHRSLMKSVFLIQNTQPSVNNGWILMHVLTIPVVLVWSFSWVCCRLTERGQLLICWMSSGVTLEYFFAEVYNPQFTVFSGLQH